MSGPVDVLEVLADYSAQHGDPEDLEQVRASVAELIEADAEFDAALDLADVRAGCWLPIEQRHRIIERLGKARKRRAEALARLQGVSA